MQFRRSLWILLAVALCASPFVRAQTSYQQVRERDVRASMQFLAGDALKGRGSGTEDEWIAAEYLGSMMMQFGVEPAGNKDSSGRTTYVQTVTIKRQGFSSAPTVTYGEGDKAVTLTHGKEMVVFRLNAPEIEGGLNKLKDGETPEKGSVALIRFDGKDEEGFGRDLGKLFGGPAAAYLVEETPQIRASWERFASRFPSFTRVEGVSRAASASVIFISKAAAEALSKVADGTQIKIGGELTSPEIRHTWNAMGMIEGSDPARSKEVILLSAHLDHLGVRNNAPGDDKIFNGADDDASGCVAVLELARVIASGPKPKRTVYFAFFGSEETGGFGATYFVHNLPFAKKDLVANLEFEMIGRPDPAVASDELWLTGYDRSNLGAELAKRGAKIVNDPHPDENFFQRSDNYTLARQGIIAHTISSFGLHKDYHRPSDEVGKINFEHMTRSVNSMIEPVEWLLNTDFRPTWYEGKDPSQ